LKLYPCAQQQFMRYRLFVVNKLSYNLLEGI
jgi:hypothetical protein